MRFRPPSVRARLTLWHAGVLTLIVCVFSAAILLFVEARLYAGLDAQLSREVATIGKIYRDEPDELRDLAPDWGITLFQVDDGGVPRQSEAWEREGLSRALQTGGSTSPLSWTGPDGRRYRVHSVSESSYRVTAAVDETSLQDTLWTLAVILAMGIPFAAGLAIAGGYFLAGRVLSPVGAMAQQAREITAESLAKRLRFFSIGTNDLIQYSLAVDRMNEKIAHLYEPTHPAIIRLIKATVDAARKNKISVSVCGEMAGEPIMAPLLIGLGVDELSAAPPLVPQVKYMVRRLKLAESQALAEFALNSESGSEILAKCQELAWQSAPSLFESKT